MEACRERGPANQTESNGEGVTLDPTLRRSLLPTRIPDATVKQGSPNVRNSALHTTRLTVPTRMLPLDFLLRRHRSRRCRRCRCCRLSLRFGGRFFCRGCLLEGELGEFRSSRGGAGRSFVLLLSLQKNRRNKMSVRPLSRAERGERERLTEKSCAPGCDSTCVSLICVSSSSSASSLTGCSSLSVRASGILSCVSSTSCVSSISSPSRGNSRAASAPSPPVAADAGFCVDRNASSFALDDEATFEEEEDSSPSSGVCFRFLVFLSDSSSRGGRRPNKVVCLPPGSVLTLALPEAFAAAVLDDVEALPLPDQGMHQRIPEELIR